MLLTASGGRNQKYNEQVATPCGKAVKNILCPSLVLFVFTYTLCKVAIGCACFTNNYNQLAFQDFDFTEEEKSMYINLTKYLNPTPYTVTEVCCGRVKNNLDYQIII